MKSLPHATPAEAEIRARIAARGRIPFEEFMELALYHPAGGYYTRESTTTGNAGDFSTSSDLSPAFGQRIALQVAEFVTALGSGAWDLVELGPGRGLLAADLLDGLAANAPEVYARLRSLTLVETSGSLRAHQHRRLANRLGAIELRQVASLEELGRDSLRGVVVANELFDALPVHWVVRRGLHLLERAVAIDDNGALVLVDGDEPNQDVLWRIDQYGLCAGEGFSGEVCLAAESLIREVGRVLARGAAVVIDYGHDARTLTYPERSDGTLMSYWKHQAQHDLLARPGLQDITAHVNWTQLEKVAQRAGFTVAGRTTQDKFLLSLGILDDMLGVAQPALAARALVLASGAGRRFQISLWTKGLDIEPRGLRWQF
ncbi:MAG: SAM-dependent methyltransferase [Acidobacteriota bacterium]